MRIGFSLEKEDNKVNDILAEMILKRETIGTECTLGGDKLYILPLA